MTLIEHLEELRNRLFIAIIAWVVGSGITFVFRMQLLAWLQGPLPDSYALHFFSFIEPFAVSMQISAFFGFILASPVIFGQLWGFIAPGLYPEERRWAVPFIFFTVFSFAVGVAFSRYVVLPFIIPVLLMFLGEEAAGVLSIRTYISQVILYMALCGVVFEMPVLSFLLSRLGLVRASFLSRYRRHALIGNLILAAGITPTGDPLSLALVGIPLVLLYEISIVVARFSQRKVDYARENPETTRPD